MSTPDSQLLITPADRIYVAGHRGMAGSAICRALMAEFQVLILDEPCAGLDPVAREHFLQWMQSLAGQPHSPSLVMVTHHVEEILPSITHVLMMRDGRIHASGIKKRTLTSANLSTIYGAPVKLSRHGERYALRLLEAR